MRFFNIILTLLMVTPANAGNLPGDFSLFSPPAENSPPHGQLQGRLTIKPAMFRLQTHLVQDDDGQAQKSNHAWRTLPEFSFAYIQSGYSLIPVRSGAIATDHRVWEWVLTAGKLWRMGDRLRASVPFALMEKNENCLHNGVLQFDLRPNTPAVPVRLQIASETCAYFKFDMWGTGEGIWQKENLQKAPQALKIFQQEHATALPTAPITELVAAHPHLRLEKLSESSRVPVADMTQFGLLYDSLHYTGGCLTRRGIYPHCDQMVMPSYSFAKSLVAGFALMRLEKLYTGAAKAKIADYVPECQGTAWRGVTFENMLDMTSGNYHQADAHTDEASDTYQTLFHARSHADKIAFACNAFPHKAAPGTTFAYHTSDTYILGVAINAFWREKHGKDGDFFTDIIVRDIFQPLGLSASSQWTRRTRDQERQPLTGWGLMFTRDDLAKLLMFMGGHHPTLRPTDLFSSRMWQAAMQQNAADRGLPVAGTAKHIRYSHGFWAYSAQDDLGCGQEIWLPFMSGYGGLSAVLLPGNMSYYSISDSGHHAFMTAVTNLNHLQSLCAGDPE